MWLECFSLDESNNASYRHWCNQPNTPISSHKRYNFTWLDTNLHWFISHCLILHRSYGNMPSCLWVVAKRTTLDRTRHEIWREIVSTLSLNCDLNMWRPDDDDAIGQCGKYDWSHTYVVDATIGMIMLSFSWVIASATAADIRAITLHLKLKYWIE